MKKLILILMLIATAGLVWAIKNQLIPAKNLLFSDGGISAVRGDVIKLVKNGEVVIDSDGEAMKYTVPEGKKLSISFTFQGELSNE